MDLLIGFLQAEKHLAMNVSSASFHPHHEIILSCNSLGLGCLCMKLTRLEYTSSLQDEVFECLITTASMSQQHNMVSPSATI